MFFSHACGFDISNGASIANRSLSRVLARFGCAVEVLSGSHRPRELGSDPTGRPLAVSHEDWAGAIFSLGVSGTSASAPRSCRLIDRGVPTTLHQPALGAQSPPGEEETTGFLHLFDDIVARFRPDVVLGYGGDPIALATFARARSLGIATVFTLHNFHYRGTTPFDDSDAILVASRFAADYYREALGLECVTLPQLLDDSRPVESTKACLTFVNPSIEKGVYPFARIADELGRRRPDIPILVVESRGTEATVAACGLELREHGNVFFMPHTADPRSFWGVTRVCLLPSVWWENQSLVAVEALVNGIPVVGSDRGGNSRDPGLSRDRTVPARTDHPGNAELAHGNGGRALDPGRHPALG